MCFIPINSQFITEYEVTVFTDENSIGMMLSNRCLKIKRAFENQIGNNLGGNYGT